MTRRGIYEQNCPHYLTQISDIHLYITEPLSEYEIHLLMETLPNNMNIDCAAFRHTQHGNLRNMLVRLRDSSLASMKTLSSQKEMEESSLLNRSISKQLIS